MIIARSGNFALSTKTYIGKHTYTTHDIEIIKYNEETGYTIATFDECGDMYSVGNRLLEVIKTPEDVEDIKRISKIGEAICECENIESGFRTMDKITTTHYDQDMNIKETKTRIYPNEGRDIPVYVVEHEIGGTYCLYWNEEDAKAITETDNSLRFYKTEVK